jgi:hypothetical protein
MKQADKKTEPADVRTVPTTTSCSMFEMFSGLDSLCGPSQAPNDADKAEILADPLKEAYQVPHEISITKKEGGGSFKSDACSVVHHLTEVSNRPPSMLERLTKKKKTAITLKVYVDKPSSNSSAASVDHSLLTTPSIAAGC